MYVLIQSYSSLQNFESGIWNSTEKQQRILSKQSQPSKFRWSLIMRVSPPMDSHQNWISQSGWEPFFPSCLTHRGIYEHRMRSPKGYLSLWSSKLGCHLTCQHPIRECWLKSQLLYFWSSMSADATEKKEGCPGIWAPDTHIREQDGVPGYWLWPGLARLFQSTEK